MNGTGELDLDTTSVATIAALNGDLAGRQLVALGTAACGH